MRHHQLTVLLCDLQVTKEIEKTLLQTFLPT
jgi:hypothetical protein